MRQTLAAVVMVAGMAAPAASAADVVALIERARTAAREKDPVRIVMALEEALQEARRAAPLVAHPFVIVSEKATFYGNYTPRKDNVFQGDEPVRFYLEPKNLVYPRNAEGFYTPGVAIDLEVRDAAGTVVGGQARLGVFPFNSRSPLQDIYVNLEVSMTGAPLGEYEVRFILHDINSDKTATVSRRVTRR